MMIKSINISWIRLKELEVQREPSLTLSIYLFPKAGFERNS